MYEDTALSFILFIILSFLVLIFIMPPIELFYKLKYPYRISWSLPESELNLPVPLYFKIYEDKLSQIKFWLDENVGVKKYKINNYYMLCPIYIIFKNKEDMITFKLKWC